MPARPSVLFVHYTFPGVVGGVETERLAGTGGGDEYVDLVAGGRDLGDGGDLLG